MLKRVECYIVCPRCEQKRATVYAEANDNRPDVWINKPDVNPVPKTCSACGSLLTREEPKTYTIRK